MYDGGWWQQSARDRWHHYQGVRSDCGRHELAGTPTGGFRPAPYGPGRVCRDCLKRWKSPVLHPAQKRGDW